MSKWYVRMKTGTVLSDSEYQNVPHHNPSTDNYVYLGEFENREQAKLFVPRFLDTYYAEKEVRSFVKFAAEKGIDPKILPDLMHQYNQLCDTARHIIKNPTHLEKYTSDISVAKHSHTFGEWLEVTQQDIDVCLVDKDTGEHYLDAMIYLTEEEKQDPDLAYSPMDEWLLSLPLDKVIQMNGCPIAVIRTDLSCDQTDFLFGSNMYGFDSLSVCNEYERANYADADFTARLAYLKDGTPFEIPFDGDCMDVADPQERKELAAFLSAHANVFVYTPYEGDDKTRIAYAVEFGANDQVFFEDCTATVRVTEPGKGFASTIDGKLCYAQHKAKQAKEGIQLSNPAIEVQRN